MRLGLVLSSFYPGGLARHTYIHLTSQNSYHIEPGNWSVLFFSFYSKGKKEEGIERVLTEAKYIICNSTSRSKCTAHMSRQPCIFQTQTKNFVSLASLFLPYHTSNSTANPCSSTCKIYTDSDHLASPLPFPP